MLASVVEADVVLVTPLLVAFPVEVVLLVLLLGCVELPPEVELPEVELLDSAGGLPEVEVVLVVGTPLDSRPESVEQETKSVGTTTYRAAESDVDKWSFVIGEPSTDLQRRAGRTSAPSILERRWVYEHALLRDAAFREKKFTKSNVRPSNADSPTRCA